MLSTATTVSGQTPPETQSTFAADTPRNISHKEHETHIARADVVPVPGDDSPGTDPRQLAELRLWAATYEAASKQLMATHQRLGSTDNLTQHIAGADAQLAIARQAKAHARKMMLASYRRTFPTIYQWAKSVPGLATSSDLAWLLATTGDPTVKRPHVRTETPPEGHQCSTKCGEGRHLVALETSPRTVGQLWSYCGHGAALRRRAGMTQADALALGSTQAKTLAHRMAESCMKMPGSETRARSPYRDVYDAARESVVGRDDWTDGHKHNHALRLTAKAILRDLWVVSSTTHKETT